MSSLSQPSFTGAGSDPSNSPGPSNPGNGTTSSSLYLYTFLATLLLLLAISGGIVFRSVLIRRRTRRMIEEAIRNGTWIPPAPRTPVKLSDKPALYDAYTILSKKHHDESFLKEKPGLWSAIKPVSTTLVTNEKSTTHIEQMTIQDDESITRRSGYQPLVSRLLQWRKFSSSPSSASLEATSFPAPDPTQKSTALVSVMISMPTPPEQQNLDKTGFPVVTLGIAHVPLPQNWSIDSWSSAAGVVQSPPPLPSSTE